MTIHTSVNM